MHDAREPFHPERPASWTSRELAESIAHFVAALQRLLRSPPLLDTIARRSYRHPLGFQKIVLAERADRSRLRLHLWPADHRCPRPRERGDVHTHFWDFSSRVLFGTLSNETFAVCATDDPATDAQPAACYRLRDLAGHRGRDGHVELYPIGTSHLREIETVVLSAGQRYTLRRDLPHRLSCTSPGGAATLVWQEAPSTRVNHIFDLSPSADRPTMRGVERLDPRSLAWSISALSVRLATGCG